MKCITDGKTVRRVNEQEAAHYVNHEGWQFTQKKTPAKVFVCELCGRRYETKPEHCCGKTERITRDKDGNEVVSVRECKSNQFPRRNIFMKRW